MIARLLAPIFFVLGFVAIGAFASFVSDANDFHRIEQASLSRPDGR